MAPTQPITPLRQRMLDDMKLRNMALSTRKIYVSSVAGFSAYHGRSPDQLTLEDVREAVQTAKAAADQTASTASQALVLAFIALVLGAVAAAFGGSLAVQRRVAFVEPIARSRVGS